MVPRSASSWPCCGRGGSSSGRKEGTSVYYRVADPLVFELLDMARAIFDRHLVFLQAMADAEADDDLATIGLDRRT